MPHCPESPVVILKYPKHLIMLFSQNAFRSLRRGQHNIQIPQIRVITGIEEDIDKFYLKIPAHKNFTLHAGILTIRDRLADILLILKYFFVTHPHPFFRQL